MAEDRDRRQAREALFAEVAELRERRGQKLGHQPGCLCQSRGRPFGPCRELRARIPWWLLEEIDREPR